MRQAFASERSPAASWGLAARLAPTLSDAQLAALKAPRVRERGERAARGERGDRAQRPRPERVSGDRRERPSAKQRDAMRAEMDAARDAALGLTAQQKQALTALRAERQDARDHDAMAEVLTDDRKPCSSCTGRSRARVGCAVAMEAAMEAAIAIAADLTPAPREQAARGGSVSGALRQVPEAEGGGSPEASGAVRSLPSCSGWASASRTGASGGRRIFWPIHMRKV